MPRLHTGKEYEYYLWRDLCGEQHGGGLFQPAKYCRWQSYAGAGSILLYMNAHHPISNECERDGMEARLEYYWDLLSVGPDHPQFYWRVEWNMVARTISGELDVNWSGGHANAKVTITQPPSIKLTPTFGREITWNTQTTTSTAKWDWGLAGVGHLLDLRGPLRPYNP